MDNGISGEKKSLPRRRQFVVGDAVGAALGVGQMPQHDHRRLGQPEMRRRQHRHGSSELGHASGEPQDLIGIMGLGIADVGFEMGEGPVFDPLRHGGRVHAASLFVFRLANVSPVSASTALPEEIAAVRATPEQIARTFARVRTTSVQPLLESLTALGQARMIEGGRFAE